MVRTARMRGRQTLWVPGTDHAGIATQVRGLFATQLSLGSSQLRCFLQVCSTRSHLPHAHETHGKWPSVAGCTHHRAKSMKHRHLHRSDILRYVVYSQSVVEKMLAKEGVSRATMGREEFTKRVC
jgi:hypothetical protein